MSDGNGNGIYQWVAGGFATAFLFVIGIFQRGQRSSLMKTKEDVRELYQRTNKHTTSIAVLETYAKTQSDVLRSIEKKVDRLLEGARAKGCIRDE